MYVMEKVQYVCPGDSQRHTINKRIPPMNLLSLPITAHKFITIFTLKN